MPSSLVGLAISENQRLGRANSNSCVVSSSYVITIVYESPLGIDTMSLIPLPFSPFSPFSGAGINTSTGSPSDKLKINVTE